MDKELNNILNDCLERLLIKGDTLEQCLRDYPQQAAELEPLLHVAMASRKALDIEPRPEFRARARYQFQSALQEAAAKKQSRFSLRLFPRWAAVSATAVGILLIFSGVVGLSQSSMPDSPLYAMKLATEQVQLNLTRSDTGKAELNAELADRRVTEIAYLADKGDAGQIAVVTQRLDNQLGTLTGLVVANNDAQAVRSFATVDNTMTSTTTASTTAVPSAIQALPPSQTAGAPVTDATVGAGKEQAPVPTETPAPVNLSPNVNAQSPLKTKLTEHLNNQSVVLQNALQNAPESSRPALEQALAVVESNYQIILNSME